MAIPITIPRLGWNMEEGVFLGWLKANGSAVHAGEALFTLESDKATEDIESLDDGILHIPAEAPRAGDRIAVGTVIGYLGKPGETSVPSLQPQVQQKIKISPRARRAARALGIDWTRLQGSGRSGRIRERDVRAAAQTKAPVAVHSIRRTIAEHMLASHRSTAPVTLTTTVDATNLVNLRNQFKAVTQDIVPSYADFIVKLTGIALQKHPQLNAHLDKDQPRMSERIDIGIAVDTDAGLLVPILRDVPSVGLKQLAAQSHALVERARQGRLTAADMRGGTFTVTNLGAFGIDAFTPLIHLPQCAILGMGRIQRRPVVQGEQITAREQLTLSLTFDHRMVDGAPAARFLRTVGGLIENPGPWLMT